MTPEEEDIRKQMGIVDDVILLIPSGALWELCRQFDYELPGCDGIAKKQSKYRGSGRRRHLTGEK